MSTFNLDEMTWQDVDNLDRNKTLFLLSVSPIEEHGPHLPMGTDFYGARDMAACAMQLLEKRNPSLNYVLCPGIPLGCTEMAMDFPGTLSIRGKTMKRIIYDVCSAIARHGFKYVVISNHHLDLVHVKAISIACKKVMKKYDITVYEPASAVIYSGETHEEHIGEEMGIDMHKEIHADVRETSFIKYKYPKLLRSCYKDLPPVLVDIAQCMRKGLRSLKKMGAEMGYIGTPARATSEYGKAHLTEGAEILADAALKLYRGDKLPKMAKHMRFVLRFFVRLD